MSSELLAMANAVAHEKNVPESAVFDALETAFAAVVRRTLGAPGSRVSVTIDRRSGDLAAVRTWTVADPVLDPENERLPATGQAVGDAFDEPVAPPAFTRQTAAAVRQVVIQRLRQAVRQGQADAWADRVGEVVYGTVVRVDKKSGIWVALSDGTEAFLGRSEQIPGEAFRVGQRLRALLAEVSTENKGSPLMLSRRAPEFLQGLMAAEIPEIGEGFIAIAAVARDPGQRAKVAVVPSAKFSGDPIGACIGMRGARIQAVAEELAGERIDLVRWDVPLGQQVLNSLVPAEVERLIVDEENKVAMAAVPDDRLARAIGRAGQNVHLASRLSGFEIRVMSPAALDEELAKERAQHRQTFQAGLEVDAELADALIDAGFTHPSDLLVPDVDQMLGDGFDADLIQALTDRAREFVLTEDLRAATADAGALAPFQGLSGLTADSARALVGVGVCDAQAVADSATDELVEALGWPAETCAALILAARAPLLAQAA